MQMTKVKQMWTQAKTFLSVWHKLIDIFLIILLLSFITLLGISLFVVNPTNAISGEEIRVAIQFEDGEIFKSKAKLEKFKANENLGMQNFGYHIKGDYDKYWINLIIIDKDKKIILGEKSERKNF